MFAQNISVSVKGFEDIRDTKESWPFLSTVGSFNNAGRSSTELPSSVPFSSNRLVLYKCFMMLNICEK